MNELKQPIHIKIDNRPAYLLNARLRFNWFIVAAIYKLDGLFAKYQ